MNKKILNIILSGAAILALTGCTANTPNTPAEKKEAMIETVNDLPTWVVNPKVEGGIAAVGLTSYSKHGMSVMLPQAEVDARSKLAGQIQTIVSQVQERSMRNSKINELDDLDSAFKLASKEVIKQIPLSGAQRKNIFQAKDGTLYVHMIIEKKEVSKHIGNMKETYKQYMEEAKLSRQNIEDGMKVLDNMMEDLNKEIN